MTVKIQFNESITELTLPIVKLTKSRNGKTGTATFLFIKPKIFEFISTTQITGLFLISKKQKMFTNDITICFKEGKPFLIRALFILKNPKDWFNFLTFMNLYSKETGLAFVKYKNFLS
jgi:photosystem II protein